MSIAGKNGNIMLLSLLLRHPNHSSPSEGKVWWAPPIFRDNTAPSDIGKEFQSGFFGIWVIE